jgi:transcriptional regulator with XRE-family HTH domain
MIDSKKVKALREEKGYTVRVLSALVSDTTGKTVSVQAIEKVERGELDLSVEKTAALASVLGVGIGDILLPLESAVA